LQIHISSVTIKYAADESETKLTQS